MQHNHSLSHTQSTVQRAAWLKDQSHFHTTHFFLFSHLLADPVQTGTINLTRKSLRGSWLWLTLHMYAWFCHFILKQLLSLFPLSAVMPTHCRRSRCWAVPQSLRHTRPRPAELRPLPWDSQHRKVMSQTQIHPTQPSAHLLPQVPDSHLCFRLPLKEFITRLI